MEEEHVPPRASPREPREDDTFVPSDVVDDLLLKAMEERVEPIIADKERIRRQSVTYMFICTFGAESDKAKWSRKYGCISAIRKYLSIPPTTEIAYILEDVLQCIKYGSSYNGEHRPTKDDHICRKPFIPV